MDTTPSDTVDRRSFLRSAAFTAGAVVSGGVVARGEHLSLGDLSNPRHHRPETVAIPGQGKTIGLSVNTNVPYVQYVATGVKAALAGTGYKLRITDAALSATAQLTQIESLISAGIAGLVILAVDDATANEGAAKAAARGLPVANTLWPGPRYPGQAAADKYYTSVVYVDSYHGGQLIGNWLKKNAKPGKTVVVQGIVGQGFSEVIDKGLNHALARSGFDIVVRQQGFFERSEAIKIVESALAAHPDITTIVDYAAAMGDGIASYLKSRGIKHITHVTSDGDLEMVHRWLGTPYLAADRYYSAGQTGLLATLAVREKLEKGRKGTFIRPAFQGIATKHNIRHFETIHPLLYPKYFKQVASL